MATVCEGEEEMELSLGLSIGGCFRGSDAAARKPVSPAGSGDGESELAAAAAAAVAVDAESNAGVEMFKRRKELHALRRQEARRKRDEKQHKRGLCRRSERGLLEAQVLQCRLRDRAAKEMEAYWGERDCKQSKGNGGQGEQSVLLGLNPSPHLCPNLNANPSSSHFPVIYPFHPVQHMPAAAGNGFSFPYMMPCWGPPVLPASATGEGFGPDKDGLRPTPMPPVDSSPTVNQQAAGDLEENVGKSSPSGSQGSSPSSVSDGRSLSLQGEACSDTTSHKYQTELCASPLPNGKDSPAHHGSSPQHKSPLMVHNAEKPHESAPQAEPISTNTNPKTPAPRSSISLSSQERREKESPPEPKPTSLPQMPCVSTTGNGPNGKTIMGFLYRYTKSEVSIVCVCHGSSFSPAEFVKHAGGTDISHPLKHIVVVPSAFG